MGTAVLGGASLGRSLSRARALLHAAPRRTPCAQLARLGASSSAPSEPNASTTASSSVSISLPQVLPEKARWNDGSDAADTSSRRAAYEPPSRTMWTLQRNAGTSCRSRPSARSTRACSSAPREQERGPSSSSSAASARSVAQSASASKLAYKLRCALGSPCTSRKSVSSCPGVQTRCARDRHVATLRATCARRRVARVAHSRAPGAHTPAHPRPLLERARGTGCEPAWRSRWWNTCAGTERASPIRAALAARLSRLRSTLSRCA